MEQLVHADAPVTAEKVPGKQDVHVLDAEIEKVPTEQPVNIKIS